jgi:hypothetical protein
MYCMQYMTSRKIRELLDWVAGISVGEEEDGVKRDSDLSSY